MTTIKLILAGIKMFILEWLLWANILGHIIYLGNLNKPYDYSTILIAGTIFYIILDFVRLKIDEITQFLRNRKD